CRGCRRRWRSARRCGSPSPPRCASARRGRRAARPPRAAPRSAAGRAPCGEGPPDGTYTSPPLWWYTSAMKIGIGIGDVAGVSADPDGLIAQARKAEADGFASGWLANIFGMDAIMAAALCARETERIELGTAVVPTYPRHPVAMAQQALSAAAISRGRFTLGVGLSHQVVIEGMFGLSFAKPYSHMREYLAVLAPLIRAGSVQHAGEEYTVGANVSVPGAKPCPILVAALAPKM